MDVRGGRRPESGRRNRREHLIVFADVVDRDDGVPVPGDALGGTSIAPLREVANISTVACATGACAAAAAMSATLNAIHFMSSFLSADFVGNVRSRTPDHLKVNRRPEAGQTISDPRMPVCCFLKLLLNLRDEANPRETPCSVRVSRRRMALVCSEGTAKTATRQFSDPPHRLLDTPKMWRISRRRQADGGGVAPAGTVARNGLPHCLLAPFAVVDFRDAAERSRRSASRHMHDSAADSHRSSTPVSRQAFRLLDGRLRQAAKPQARPIRLDDMVFDEYARRMSLFPPFSTMSSSMSATAWTRRRRFSPGSALR